MRHILLPALLASALSACALQPSVPPAARQPKPAPTATKPAPVTVQTAPAVPPLSAIASPAAIPAPSPSAPAARDGIMVPEAVFGSPAFNALKDAAPEASIDVSAIPDAEPRDEPLAAFGNTSPYSVWGETYNILPTAKGFRQSGKVSWYGKKFHGRRTSSGEPYDMYAMTAAHRHLPLPTYVRVRCNRNNATVIVKVNDRGPFHSDRIMDLSWAAARKLGIDHAGTGRCDIEALDPAEFQRQLAGNGRATEPAKPDTATTTGEQFYVQVASFSGLDNATNLQAQLLALVYAPVTIARDERRPLHRVQVGPFSNDDEARKMSERIRDAKLGDPIIVKR